MGLHEIHVASTLIQEAAHEDANIIFGSVIDENMTDELKVTVIATGFERMEERRMDNAHSSAPQKAEHDIPTIIRNRREQERLTTQPTPAPTSAEVYEDAYDVPAFLRRTTD